MLNTKEPERKCTDTVADMCAIRFLAVAKN